MRKRLTVIRFVEHMGRWGAYDAAFNNAVLYEFFRMLPEIANISIIIDVIFPY